MHKAMAHRYTTTASPQKRDPTTRGVCCDGASVQKSTSGMSMGRLGQDLGVRSISRDQFDVNNVDALRYLIDSQNANTFNCHREKAYSR